MRLDLEDHDVFFDRQDLQSGRGYDKLIRQEVESCDLFVFLVSPNSITKGRCMLTELKFATQQRRNLNGRILPVMVRPTQLSEIPAALTALDILDADGNLAAEVVARIAQMAGAPEEDEDSRRLNRLMIAGASTVVVILAALIGYSMSQPDFPITGEAIDEPSRVHSGRMVYTLYRTHS